MAGDMPASAVARPLGAEHGHRASAVRHGLLFLLICSPLWVAPRVVWQGYPFTLPLMMVLTLFFLRREGRSGAAIGLDLSWRRVGELVGGLSGGALLVSAIAVCVAIALPFPWFRNPVFEARLALMSLLSLLYGNAVEELIFRGYSFDRLIAGIGHWQAQLVTAMLFALFHVASGWPWQAALLGTTTGSLLFGLVFVRWHSVPAAVGVHAAANWMRDVLMLDPPGRATLFGPVAPRPWTAAEQWAAHLAWQGVMLLACVALWLSTRRRGIEVRESTSTPGL